MFIKKTETKKQQSQKNEVYDKLKKIAKSEKNEKYTRHEHRATPTIFYLKLWTFALLCFYLDIEFLGLFGVFVDF